MRAIIDGKKYDTEVAEKIASWWNSYSVSDFHYCSETLYRTTKGNWFLHGDGGALSKYSEPCGNGVGGGSVIIPFSTSDAKDWMERTQNYDALEQHFADDIEEA